MSKIKFNLYENLDKWKIKNVPLRDILIKYGYLFLLIILIPLMFPTGRSFKYTDLNVGIIVNKKVIAPFTFPVLKTEGELKAERQAAKSEIPYYFIMNDSLRASYIQNANNLFSFILDIPKDLDLNISSINKRLGMDTTNVLNIDKILGSLYSQFKINLSSQEIINLISYSRKRSFGKIPESFLFELTNLLNLKYINIVKSEIINKKIVMIENGVEEKIDFDSVIDVSNVKKLISQKFVQGDNYDLLRKILLQFFKPYVIYDKQITEQRQKEAIAAVPSGKDLVYENERIIDANERVTVDIYQRLYSLEIATAKKSSEEGDLSHILSDIGKYLLTAIILFLFIIYLYVSRPKIFHDNKKLFLVTLLVLLQVGFGALIVGPLGWPFYLVPTSISSMLFGILFDAGVGFVGTVVIGLLLGGITSMDYSFTMQTLFVGMVAIYSVAQIRTRNQIFKAIIYIASAYLLVIFTFGTLRFESFEEMFQTFVYFILPNAILSPVITYMTLGAFERYFDITTDVTLLELSDLNNPVLKELALKASGTFHHSIVVGNLAEAAAIAIGANSLLARVGSYYHDIGKMVKPEYFVENQKGNENKHKNLAPNMSALILSSHVKNGLELAEKHNLPLIIRDFIPEHHGTNLMSFFYNKALKSKDSKNVIEGDYRYPGPIPRSKETAIVMLADTVEAATRTLKNPSPGSLRKLAEELVESRFLSGELDNSDLTMRDVKSVIDGFVSVLLGIFHQRIEYPKLEKINQNDQTSA